MVRQIQRAMVVGAMAMLAACSSARRAEPPGVAPVAIPPADAAQLAAALTLAENQPAVIDFVSLDQRLRDAAAREGFTRVLPHPMS